MKWILKYGTFTADVKLVDVLNLQVTDSNFFRIVLGLYFFTYYICYNRYHLFFDKNN